MCIKMYRYLFLAVLIFFGFYQHANGTTQLWLNRDGSPGGTLYYRLVKSLLPCSVQTIQNTIKDFHKLLNPTGSSCIKLVEENDPSAPISVSFKHKFDGCTFHTDLPGMPTLTFPPMQIPIGVNDNCIDRRKVVYILARILGLPDEHTRPDRDHFLTIHNDNIKSEFHRFYDKSPNELWTNIEGLPYDYTSVTHVGPFEHALDSKKPTVSSKYPGVHFGDKMNLSVIDVQKLRTLYKCPTEAENQYVAESEYRPVHCTFDLPMCELVNDWTLHGDKWIKRRGAVTENGPYTDHSNGDGWYMYTNQTHSTSTASLVSRTEIFHGPVCVSLYYYVEDNSTTLIVSQKDSLNGNTSTLQEISSNGSPSWSEIRFNVTSSTMWRISIRASVVQGGVAIDDVTVQYGDCPAYSCDTH
ncbi:meprin A subunit alpha-like [Crassostrea virginica]